MSEIERLRALLAEATPGPWTETCGVLKHYVTLSELQGFSLQEMSPHDGSDQPAHADAALIAAAVNALPALLDVAEAAERFVEFSPVEQDPADAVWIAETLHGALRAALDRLEGAS